ncbi:hypothetical protein M9H77_14549 [Catharanthus roseus]|uniref:Uncharacterized protein n=1 Tax=Catharanthus roseus TaxID=4058 RepID=A0ACC0BNF2_CATRO|nr:hypothetical protein M9H77_14549 [Catharanthus roseus]
MFPKRRSRKNKRNATRIASIERPSAKLCPVKVFDYTKQFFCPKTHPDHFFNDAVAFLFTRTIKTTLRGDDIGLVTDRTDQIQGRVVTALSRGVRGRHSTSDIPYIPAPFGPGIYYDPGAPGSSTQPPHLLVRTRPPLPSHCPHTPIPYDPYGSSQLPSQPLPTSYDPHAHAPSVPPHMPAQEPPLYRSKHQQRLNEPDIVRSLYIDGEDDQVEPKDDDDDGDSDDNEDEPVLGPYIIVRLRSLGLDKKDLRSRLFLRRLRSRHDQLIEVHRIQCLSLRTADILLVLYGMDKSELVGIIQRDLGITYFGCGINAQELAQVVEDPDTVRPGANSCKPYIQRYAILGYKSEHKLVHICLQLDMMTDDEVRWTLYKPFEIQDLWVTTWYGILAYFDSHPIRPLEARRPANNRMYVLKNAFIETLWLEAPSHLLTKTWTNVPIVPPSRCTYDYIPWFIPRTHPKIQNPERLPCRTIFDYSPHIR